jgi:hypothetical protein
MNHTTGPWNVVNNRYGHFLVKNGICIASINDCDISKEQRIANAKLMSHAPAMYRILQDINVFGLLTGEYGNYVKRLLAEIEETDPELTGEYGFTIISEEAA